MGQYIARRILTIHALPDTEREAAYQRNLSRPAPSGKSKGAKVALWDRDRREVLTREAAVNFYDDTMDDIQWYDPHAHVWEVAFREVPFEDAMRDIYGE
jgi:hypothetical protein